MPRQAFILALGNHSLFVSPETLDELGKVLLRLKFDAYASAAEGATCFAKYKQETMLLAPDAQSKKMAEALVAMRKTANFWRMLWRAMRGFWGRATMTC